MRPRPAVAFIDRDGTINVKAPEGEYITRPNDVELLPGAAAAVARLNAAGVAVAVVTNQRGIALGRMDAADLAAVHDRLDALLALGGARIDRYEHCPHDKGVCRCRKPGAEMLLRAAAALGASPRDGVMVGDAASDVMAGRAAGAMTVRIGASDPDADTAVPDLLSAVDWILAEPTPPASAPSSRRADP